MILTLETSENLIFAYIVFVVVDKETKLDNEGQYILINGYWINEAYRKYHREILKDFIHKIFVHPTTQKAEFVYWEREGMNKKPKTYLMSRFIKKIGIYE